MICWKPAPRNLALALALIISNAASSHTLVMAQALPATPQPTTAEPDSLEAINAAFNEEIAAAEFKRLERIAGLAGKKTGEEAESLWRLYFDTVVAEELFVQAEATAEKVTQIQGLPLDIKVLAEVTHIISEARRGAIEESLASMKKMFQAQPQRMNDEQILPSHVQLGLVEVYLRTIVDSGRYDLAKQAIQTIQAEAKSMELQEYLTGELTSLERIGKPAPVVKGTDVDGRPFDLASFKGKPVLITFWATWNEVSEDLIDNLMAVTEAYKEKGLEVITINVDRLREDAEPPADLDVEVRRFLVERNLLWKSLISENGDKDFAKILGVRYLPSNIIIDREGIIRHVDRSPVGLESAIAEVCK